MKFYEFFAGGGMARLGLGPAWDCVFANDIDPRKAASYRAAFGESTELALCDLAQLRATDIPGRADLAWASFPCQDLSLAGVGKGLKGQRSGLFWTFWELMRELGRANRPPRVIALENVYGAVTSHKGKDLAAICEALAHDGYAYMPLVVDAQLFLPQSRPRLFLVAINQDTACPASLFTDGPSPVWHPESFGMAYDMLSARARDAWKWVNPLPPPLCRPKLSDVIDDDPIGVVWHTPFETKRLLEMMSPINQEKVLLAKASGKKMIGTVYKRTRTDASGERKQRAEVRFDEVAGCLRTPAGGSSRQIILVVEGARIQSRLLGPREAARLMGLPEEYPLPPRYNDAYRLAGDGVAVPVVSWLAKSVIEPALEAVRAVEAA